MTRRLYLDENVSDRLAPLLTALGRDVETTSDAGNKGASDAVQLFYALHEDRITLTHNLRDFRLLHETLRLWSGYWQVGSTRRHAGMLIFPDPGTLGIPEATALISNQLDHISDCQNRLFLWQFSTGWREIVR